MGFNKKQGAFQQYVNYLSFLFRLFRPVDKGRNGYRPRGYWDVPSVPSVPSLSRVYAHMRTCALARTHTCVCAYMDGTDGTCIRTDYRNNDLGMFRPIKTGRNRTERTEHARYAMDQAG